MPANHSISEGWGRRRNPNDWTYTNVPTTFKFDRGFTGHEHLDAFNIINMNGRVYDPYTATFISPDPYVQNPSSSQSFNRYGYCNYNPFKYIDPSGNEHEKPFYWHGMGYDTDEYANYVLGYAWMGEVLNYITGTDAGGMYEYVDFRTYYDNSMGFYNVGGQTIYCGMGARGAQLAADLNQMARFEYGLKYGEQYADNAMAYEAKNGSAIDPDKKGIIKKMKIEHTFQDKSVKGIVLTDETDNSSYVLLTNGEQSSAKHYYANNCSASNGGDNQIKYNVNGSYTEPKFFGYDMYLNPKASKDFIKGISNALTVKAAIEGTIGTFVKVPVVDKVMWAYTMVDAGNTIYWNEIMNNYDGSGLIFEYRNYNLGNKYAQGFFTIYNQSNPNQELGIISLW